VVEAILYHSGVGQHGTGPQLFNFQYNSPLMRQNGTDPPLIQALFLVAGLPSSIFQRSEFMSKKIKSDAGTEHGTGIALR
jgi:hypothetical protein